MARPGFPVPNDDIGDGSGQRCWVYSTLYGDTMEEVATKRDNYLKEWPPQGYSTRTVGSKVFKHHHGYYYVRMQRWSTCD